jgi:hypothetical protein
MNHSAQRRVGVVALAIGVVVLSGCTAQTSGSPESSRTPTTNQSKPATPTAESSPAAATGPETALPADLSFEAAGALPAGDWEVGWGDNFPDSPGFSVLRPDEGDGSYSYADTTTQCQMFFYQGSVTDLDMTQDDRTISDDFLATVLTGTVEGATREDVAAHAFDDLVAQYPGPGTASTRTIWGTGSDGGTWLHAARMFGAVGGGVYIGITCPDGQDASAELSKLVQDHLVLMVTPAA